jgi:hypothetical protein
LLRRQLRCACRGTAWGSSPSTCTGTQRSTAQHSTAQHKSGQHSTAQVRSAQHSMLEAQLTTCPQNGVPLHSTLRPLCCCMLPGPRRGSSLSMLHCLPGHQRPPPASAAAVYTWEQSQEQSTVPPCTASALGCVCHSATTTSMLMSCRRYFSM